MTTQTLITVSPDELEKMIFQAVKDNIGGHAPPVEDPELFTPQHTAGIFKISLPTLRSWRMRGVIKSIKVGGRRYYRRSEVENLIHEKYNR